MAYKVLAVDDEFGILEVVQAYLVKEGYEVYTAFDGKQAVALFEQVKPDLVVLDLMLPDMTGEAVCTHIRKSSDIPVIMLTAKKEEADRLGGLGAGADDYMVKPFSPKELMMRIQIILRRVYGGGRIEKREIEFGVGDLVILPEETRVLKKGAPVDLTKSEYEILMTFVRNPSRTFTREQLIETTFGADYPGFDRTIDVHVKNLRRKLEDDPKNPTYLVTVYGFGYKWNQSINSSLTSSE